MKRVLVTGASGLLGGNLALDWRDGYEVVAGSRATPAQIEGCRAVCIDIADPENTRATLHQITPEIVVHCAAETRVDDCQRHPEEARRANVVGTENLARAAADVGALLVYISTDSVFDGRSSLYSESAQPNPLNVYALSKLEGEQATRRLAPEHLIVRTNIYGWNARPKLSLAEWILERVNSEGRVAGFRDVFFSPILANDLGEVLVTLIEGGHRGLFHVGGREPISKYEFARAVCGVFGLDAGSVDAVSVASADFVAPRPLDTSLDVSKVSTAAGRAMPSVLEGLKRFRRLLETGHTAQLRAAYQPAHVGREAIWRI